MEQTDSNDFIFVNFLVSKRAEDQNNIQQIQDDGSLQEHFIQNEEPMIKFGEKLCNLKPEILNFLKTNTKSIILHGIWLEIPYAQICIPYPAKGDKKLINMSFNDLKPYEAKLGLIEKYYFYRRQAYEQNGNYTEAKKCSDDEQQALDMINHTQSCELKSSIPKNDLMALDKQINRNHPSKRQKTDQNQIEQQPQETGVQEYRRKQFNTVDSLFPKTIKQSALQIYDDTFPETAEFIDFRNKLKFKLNFMMRNDQSQFDIKLLKFHCGKLLKRQNFEHLTYSLRMPGTYVRPSKIKQKPDEKVYIPLINFNNSPDIRIDSSQKIPEQNQACFVLATHFNQLLGRLVFNSFELFCVYLANSLDMDSEVFAEKFVHQQPIDFDLQRLYPALFDNEFNFIKFTKFAEYNPYIHKTDVSQIDRSTNLAIQNINNDINLDERVRDLEIIAADKKGEAEKYKKYSHLWVPYMNEEQTLYDFVDTEMEQNNKYRNNLQDMFSLQVVYKYNKYDKSTIRSDVQEIYFLAQHQPPRDLVQINNLIIPYRDNNSEQGYGDNEKIEWIYRYQYFVFRRFFDRTKEKHYFIQNAFGQEKKIITNTYHCLLRDLGFINEHLQNVLKVNLYSLTLSDKIDLHKGEIERGHFTKNLFQTMHNISNEHKNISTQLTKIQDSQKVLFLNEYPLVQTYENQIRNAQYDHKKFSDNLIQELCFKYKLREKYQQLQDADLSPSDLKQLAADYQFELFDLHREAQNSVADGVAYLSNFNNFYSLQDGQGENEVDKQRIHDMIFLRECLTSNNIQRPHNYYEQKKMIYLSFLRHFYQLKQIIVDRLNAHKNGNLQFLDKEKLKFKPFESEDDTMSYFKIISQRNPKSKKSNKKDPVHAILKEYIDKIVNKVVNHEKIQNQLAVSPVLLKNIDNAARQKDFVKAVSYSMKSDINDLNEIIKKATTIEDIFAIFKAQNLPPSLKLKSIKETEHVIDKNSQAGELVKQMKETLNQQIQIHDDMKGQKSDKTLLKELSQLAYQGVSEQNDINGEKQGNGIVPQDNVAISGNVLKDNVAVPANVIINPSGQSMINTSQIQEEQKVSLLQKNTESNANPKELTQKPLVPGTYSPQQRQYKYKLQDSSQKSKTPTDNENVESTNHNSDDQDQEGENNGTKIVKQKSKEQIPQQKKSNKDQEKNPSKQKKTKKSRDSTITITNLKQQKESQNK